MDDDLGIPSALAVIHDAVRAGNQAADSEKNDVFLGAASEVRAMMAILGMDPLDPRWATGSSDDSVVASMVTKILAARQEAKNERRFDVADALRDALDSAGIDIHDGPNESTWSIRG
jgi:cysteinyl-tRNA synthetase